jgi:hypothetical protein
MDFFKLTFYYNGIYLFLSGYFKALVHYYLQEDSPYFDGVKVKKGDGKPTPNDILTLQNMKHIVGTISVLITGIRIASDNQVFKN